MQVSWRSQPIFDQLSNFSWTQLRYAVKYVLRHKKRRKLLQCCLGSIGITLMLGWDTKLIGATLIGIGVMGGIYWFQTARWQSRWLDFYEFSQTFQGKLAIAVISGGLGAISSYIAFDIWSNAQSRWLATALILQGLGTFLTLGLLGWQLLDKPRKKRENQYHEWVSQLTDSNKLKRLIAVENLANLLQQKKLNQIQIQQLANYFPLMLKQETEIMVSQVVLQCCKLLNNDQRF
ncbi:hypothetical protein [Crocosphaera sp. Alani8]|uniref:hypothetical protein n=1 Tax=Crocosphaera sp. Alani8 TaxID=3038952 RepID=UPI00313DEC27